MARPWRIQYEGAVYHVMSRGVAQGEIYSIDEDYHRFLEYLEKVVEKFGIEIFAFVLMGNHYHLLLRTKEANLSKAIQWLQTSYSIYYNRRHNRSGHLFQGRYKSILVGEENYWKNLSFYIHLNPIRAGMVKELNEYKWSSYHDYAGIRKVHKWVLIEEVLRGLGKSEEGARIKYRQLIMERCGQEKRILEEIRYGLVLGSDKFVSWVEKKFVNRKVISSELPQQRKLGDNEVAEKVLDAVINGFEVEKDRIIKRRRFRQETARDVAIYILYSYTGLSNKKIGEMFGVTSTAIGKTSIRVKEQINKHKEFQKKVEGIVNSVFEV
ncbi:MAG: transposase [bacterium]